MLQHFVKGGFGTEEFTSFMKEANVGYQTFMVGLNSFMEKASYSNNKYTDVLKSLIDDLRAKIEQAKTIEEEERIWIHINKILDRMQKEADRGTELVKTFGIIAAGVAGVAIGGAVAVATKNPELIKKGMEMIAKETMKSETKIG